MCWRYWGSTFGIISILFLCLFLLCPSISPQRIKLEACSCTQNVRLEILFPAVIKFLSFHCGKLVKIRSKACYPDPISYFFFINCKIGFSIFWLWLHTTPKRIKLATSGCARLKEPEILFPTVIYFLIFPFVKMMKSTI